ncbi:DUF4937 domain-containing protein [Parashewanella spongiae]|uniref:DUF4937 domain-containing protein n=2 Tax=Parashewanella spongiae TaxID=342950 RepID=A0A3A6SWR3_9GAMM|nr:DUF4937 domain-containing protein [Parashewanella spongiae]MCL1080281.1 YdbC family protein [Parashewanella spongiae]RJY01631.1 DUF4937 domain-containing protein [Parashewanella spongiae]
MRKIRAKHQLFSKHFFDLYIFDNFRLNGVFTRTKMYAKLIKCDVLPDKKEQFSIGQQCWEETANAKGFIKQLGGWDGDQAIIFALWNDKNSVEQFMQTLHDSIAAKANQVNTYSSSNVSYLNHAMNIPAYHNSIISKSQFIRIADCTIHEGKEREFLDVQNNVWNKGMSSVRGMLGGYVWSFEKEPLRYLVSTFWSSEAAHGHYMREYFPVLKSVASVETYFTELSSNSVLVENNWFA